MLRKWHFPYRSSLKGFAQIDKGFSVFFLFFFFFMFRYIYTPVLRMATVALDVWKSRLAHVTLQFGCWTVLVFPWLGLCFQRIPSWTEWQSKFWSKSNMVCVINLRKRVQKVHALAQTMHGRCLKILNSKFLTKWYMQTVQTQIRLLLISVYAVCHSAKYFMKH